MKLRRMKTNADTTRKSTKHTRIVKRRHSIRTSLLLMVLPAILVSMAVLSALSYKTAQNMLHKATENQMEQSLSIASASIARSLSNNRMVAETLARSVETIHRQATPFGAPPATWEKSAYQDILPDFVGSNDETFGGGIWFQPYAYRADQQYFSPYCMRMRTNRMPIYMDNYSLGQGVYYTDQEWYTSATDTEETSVWSAPYFDEFAQTSMVTASAPMYDTAGRLMGVATADIDLAQMQQMILSLDVIAGGHAFLVDGDGMYIADTDETKAMKVNITEDPNPSLAALGSQMLGQTEGTGSYEVNGEEWNAWYQQIPGSDWYVVTTASRDALRADVRTLGLRLLGFSIVFAGLLYCVLSLYLRRSIIHPLSELEQATRQIADGDLSVRVENHSKNEFGAVSHSLEQMVSRLQLYVDYIREITQVLGQMADGDFVFSLQQDYVGEFAAVKSGLLNTRQRISDALREITDSAEQMSAGAQVVADSAQAQAQGATQQASSVEELSASIADIADQVSRNAQDSKLAYDKTADAGAQLTQCDTQMQTLMQAMQNVSDKAADIANIIKIIDNIAFQTNILALNAAVEAARAGTAGRGFSVVADEVRNLAAKSAEAAKHTEQLINETIEAVQHSNAVTDQAAGNLHGAVESAGAVVEISDRIAKSAQEQAAAIAQINQGLEQISAVVQNTAATAQENAATGEELSAQSRLLQNLVTRFHVQADGDEMA